MSNANVNKAKREKNDEFYTLLKDIEKELKHYRPHFAGKIVYCNCDDAEWSNFFRYFSMNFEELGLKKLIATCYRGEGGGRMTVYEGGFDWDVIETDLSGNGDFRSAECVEILKSADIVVTNPPFSLFREYVAQLVAHGKDFLIIGSANAITYRDIFRLIGSNHIWLGRNHVKEFLQPDGSIKQFGNINWFTNLEHSKRNEELIFVKRYNPVDYPTYDNYDAIEVSKVAEIPKDYDGVMGVPITFLEKYNHDRFEILGATESEGKGFSNGLWRSGVAQAMVNGERVYKRLFIRRRSQNSI